MIGYSKKYQGEPSKYIYTVECKLECRHRDYGALQQNGNLPPVSFFLLKEILNEILNESGTGGVPDFLKDFIRAGSEFLKDFSKGAPLPRVLGAVFGRQY